MLKDLIERMMHPNPQKRINIKEIKNHPWYLGNIKNFLVYNFFA